MDTAGTGVNRMDTAGTGVNRWRNQPSVNNPSVNNPSVNNPSVNNPSGTGIKVLVGVIAYIQYVDSGLADFSFRSGPGSNLSRLNVAP
jgi:hypothetical protein